MNIACSWFTIFFLLHSEGDRGLETFAPMPESCRGAGDAPGDVDAVRGGLLGRALRQPLGLCVLTDGPP